MSDREIMNVTNARYPNVVETRYTFLKEDWVNHKDLKQFYYKKSTERNCSCESPKLVELWEHDSCIRGRIDTTVSL